MYTLNEISSITDDCHYKYITSNDRFLWAFELQQICSRNMWLQQPKKKHNTEVKGQEHN